MELDLLEGLALAADRGAALAQLLPGSEDHDYYRALAAQHRGALDEADAILAAWPERHGETAGYARLVLRQRLYRVSADDPATCGAAADALRDELGASHWHEAEVAEIDPTRPTRLADAAWSGAELLAAAIAQGTDLREVTAEGRAELIGGGLDPQRRRVLLGQLGHSPHPALVDLVAADLTTRGSGGFGSLAVHAQLTLAQLRAVAARVPDLHTHAGWVAAVVQRMRPPASVDLDQDLAARTAHARALWSVVGALPPAHATLKAHVLWHLLDADRRAGVVDAERFAAYLELPRAASYAARTITATARTSDLAQLGADLRATTGLPPAGADLDLVRDLVHLAPTTALALARCFERAWLDVELATAALLAGAPDGESATRLLGPAQAAALRERVDLAWCAHNPTEIAPGAPIVLEADVKNVPELVVKVFRVDPIAYFAHARREVDADLDLDGLAATEELVLRFTEPPIRRVRRRIELPMCAAAGTYVVDLIGNGTASRAVLRTGRLRVATRVGAAGHVVTILDAEGAALPGARAWLGEREYVADARGEVVVPFSTQPQRAPLLLAHGDLTSVATLDLRAERYALGLQLVLDRQDLTAGRTARAIARLTLTVAGAPASLALLRRATWDVTLTDRRGVAVTRAQPLTLTDDDACVLEWPLGEDTAAVALTVRGTVVVASEQRELELSDRATIDVAVMHGAAATEAMYLTRAAAGWVLAALGKSGEPRARRPITVALRHRWSRSLLTVELATDERGRVELGAMPDVEWISATLGALQQSWLVGAEDPAPRELVHAVGDAIALPLPPGRAAADVIARASLVELRGGAPLRHVTDALAPLAGGVVIAGLPAGDYALQAPGLGAIALTIAEGARVAGALVTARAVLERSRPRAVLAAVTVTPEALAVTVRGATARTRVHAVATRFLAAPAAPRPAPTAPPLERRADPPRPARYVSGRELGDEIRYVLDRRSAPRYPGMLIDRPSLLLHPWSRRGTTTDAVAARPGGAFAPAPAAPARSGPYGRMRGEPGQATSGDAFATYDFLAAPPVVLANLTPGADGALAIARAALGDATCVTLVIDDPAGGATHAVALPEAPLAPRDLRLRLALAPDRHVTQRRAITPVAAGETLVIEDLATAKVHVIDTLERAHAYLLALRDDATLREFAFVTRWPELSPAERAERYSQYACHELHLFLAVKDPAFFDAVVRPTLATKRAPTFLDRWLLDADLTPYLEPAALARLNAVERALLARRLPDAGAHIARHLADAVAVLPPDPSGDGRRLDAMLGAAALAGDEGIAAAQDEAVATAMFAAERSDVATGAYGTLGGGGAAPPAPAMAPKAAKKRAERDDTEAEMADDLRADVARRAQVAPHYRAVDRTSEWAETNWWRRTPAESDASMIAPSRLWRDLAALPAGARFLSPHLGQAEGSFAEAMCALALTDLPFTAAPPALVADGPRLRLTVTGHALVATSQLTDGDLAPSGSTIVVGQSYVRADDRWTWRDGEQVERYVTGPLSPGVVYACLVVLANPSSARQRVSALVQIPRGAVPVSGAQPTHSLDVVLPPYGTHGHEVAFYFPAPGAFSHFPVHVTRGDAIVAAAPPATLTVSADSVAPDTTSWAYVSQRGALGEVVAMLGQGNLAELELPRVAWRLKDPVAYAAILGALEARHAFHAELWAYALLHRDRPRVRTWLRARGADLLGAGPALDMLGDAPGGGGVALDAEALGAYEHLEYAPLVNARAHPLGGALRILNDGLATQVTAFLDLVAHRPAPTAADLLAATAYLLAQDRVGPALAMLARAAAAPDAARDPARMQRDYLTAYAACLTGDLAAARAHVAPWRDVPIERWRRRFGALAALLDDVAAGPDAAPAIAPPADGLHPGGRDAQLGELAARQPTFDLALEPGGVRVRQQHLASLELRYFEMDIELLFSRQPFVASDVARFSFIAPGHREVITAPVAEQLVPWPSALRGKNVVVEAVAAGRRAAQVHYANDLATTVAHTVGRLRVQRASDRAALPATYVKVYARMRGGAVAFYKDGYTDLRGDFDYATLSTDAGSAVERFALLVHSDHSGATILEASPPQR